jgi:hypothetical protein
MKHFSRTQQYLKSHPVARKFFEPRKVRIWSNEHRAYWLENFSGYTTVAEFAGVYDFKDAWRAIEGAGPEKKLSLEIVHDVAFNTMTRYYGDHVRHHERAENGKADR